MSTPLIIDENVRENIRRLREFAFTKPVDMTDLAERIKTTDGKAAHMAQMKRQTFEIPFDFLVTYSVEVGHPCGMCRHMSMSVNRDGRAPNETALWTIAELFGFKGSLEKCTVWPERLLQGLAVNVLQPAEELP